MLNKGRYGGVGGIGRTVRSDVHSIAWLVPARPEVAYVGWSHQGNQGDDLIYEAHRSLLGDRRMRRAPLHGPTTKMLSVVGAKCETVLVGGGTLIGLDGWAQRLERVMAVISHDRLIVMGAGVEEPQFGRGRGVSTGLGAERWKRILSRASYVGVRGHRSQAYLASWGIDSEVVGDPVLASWLPQRSSSREPRRMVLVNFTDVSASLPGMNALRARAASAVKELQHEGFRIVVLPMDRGDAAATTVVLQDGGVAVDDVIRVRSTRDCIAAVGQASVVVSERLHGAILAARMSTPFLHVAYKPKSWDFLESIGAEGLGLSAELGSAEVRDRVLESATSGALSGDIVARTQDLAEVFRRRHDRVMG